MNPPKRYGFRVLVGSCIFTIVTIALVTYDEHLQRERRQVNVKYRLNSIKQQENIFRILKFLSVVDIFIMNPPKRYGFRVLVGSCIFTIVTIALVTYDEHLQRERRQVNVKYRLNSIKQQENMSEYELQKQKYEEYKTSHG
uniref:Uncharacterized protein n=1 Tax=Panagrolaimus sp. JU765 TaxID=591449 RepID=A0AC34PZ42_9BILA